MTIQITKIPAGYFVENPGKFYRPKTYSNFKDLLEFLRDEFGEV